MKALLDQVDCAIDIFEERTNKFATGLFLFDNAPSHKKCTDNALSALRMPKGPRKDWSNRKGGAKMRSTLLPNGEIQDLYYPEDLPENHPDYEKCSWFKGMEQIIREHGLWPASGLYAQCEGFKCPPGCMDCQCCCCRVLFSQPDFVNQKLALEELVSLAEDT